MVAPQRNRLDVLGNLLIQVFQEGAAFLLPFACVTLSLDPAGTGIEGRTEVQGARTYVLVRILVGSVLRLRGPGWGPPRTRRQRGLLIQGVDDLVIAE
jgi:hypothetical protein